MSFIKILNTRFNTTVEMGKDILVDLKQKK